MLAAGEADIGIASERLMSDESLAAFPTIAGITPFWCRKGTS